MGIVVLRVIVVNEAAALGARFKGVEHLAHGYEIAMYDDRVGQTVGACLIVAEAPWETLDCKVAEGPFVLKHKGIYYLSYSCNHTRCKDYAVGYATSACPTGPFKKYEGNPILHSNGVLFGVGHNSFGYSADGKQLLCSYHCHGPYADTYKPRRFCLNTGEFKPQPNGDDILVINGPTNE